MLAAGTAAAASFAAVTIGLPVLAPALRDEYGLSLAEIGFALTAGWVGTAVTLLPWGLLTDRIGERLVLAAGLGTAGFLTAATAFAPSYAWLIVLLTLGGAAGGCVNSASGRAVMRWFGPEQRGMALGVRQTAIPLGGFVSALTLPALIAAGGLEAAFLFLGGLCLLGAAAGAAVIRERGDDEGIEPAAVPWTLRDRKLWRLSFGSGLYLPAQVAVISFVVLYLHDERGLSTARAGLVLAVTHVGAAALRIGVGRWSDRLGERVVPLRRVGLAVFLTLGLAAILTRAHIAVLVPAFVVAGALSMAWNGLSFTAAAELAGRGRSGAAIGFQQTMLSVVGIGAPVAFAATVSATSWRTAFAAAALFPLAGALVLRPLAAGRYDVSAAAPGSASPRSSSGDPGGR